jgi:hypothetical protein
MDRSWMPPTSGIINIVVGAIEILCALATIIAGAAGAALLMNMFHLDLPGWILGAVLIGSGAIYLIFGILAVVGGYYALKRKLWGLALTGGIMCIFLFWPLAVASIVFLILGHAEFKKQVPI